MKLGPQELAATIHSVQSLPASFDRINAAVNDANASAQDIADAIATDQSVAMRLLRLANSSLYAFSTRVESISQAVVIIGTRQIRELALATVLMDMLADVDSRLFDLRRFWLHAFCSGCLSRCIANLRREPNAERHFVAGLLASMGRLLLYQRLPKEGSAALEANHQGTLLHRAERDIFGYPQNELGAVLIRRWNLPDSLADAVAHQYGGFHYARQPLGAALVHLSTNLATAMDLGSNGECWVADFDSEAWDLAHFPPEALEDLIEDVAAQAADLMDILMGQVPA